MAGQAGREGRTTSTGIAVLLCIEIAEAQLLRHMQLPRECTGLFQRREVVSVQLIYASISTAVCVCSRHCPHAPPGDGRAFGPAQVSADTVLLQLCSQFVDMTIYIYIYISSDYSLEFIHATLCSCSPTVWWHMCHFAGMRPERPKQPNAPVQAHPLVFFTVVYLPRY